MAITSEGVGIKINGIYKSLVLWPSWFIPITHWRPAFNHWALPDGLNAYLCMMHVQTTQGYNYDYVGSI